LVAVGLILLVSLFVIDPYAAIGFLALLGLGAIMTLFVILVIFRERRR